MEVHDGELLALLLRFVRPSTVMVPSCGPAEKVIVFSPWARAGRGACECWMSWVIFRLSSPVPVALQLELQAVVVAAEDDGLEVDLLLARWR